MTEQLITEIQRKMLPYLNNEQLMHLRDAMAETLEGATITYDSGSIPADETDAVEAFITAKRIEGCSEKTLSYYRKTIEALIAGVGKAVQQITTDDLRRYLTSYQVQRRSSKVTIDNIRRILSSFFSWLEDEDFIVKSPVRRIHKVKTAKVVKDTYTDEALELMRDNCTTARDLAMIDLLASSGMRVGELVTLNREDINFNERECVVIGKGNKERLVYFDARTKIHLQNYLEGRSDENPALFVSLKAPFDRLMIGGVETRLRELGKRLNIPKVHPHKFRRTLATTAIDKGMPIEQVQQLLGHQKIDTTMHYAMVKQQNVKLAHRKYIGYPKFLEKLSICRDLFHGFSYEKFMTGSDLDRAKLISGGVNFILGKSVAEYELPDNEKTQNVFIKEALLLKQALSLCSSLVDEQTRMEAAFFESVRTMTVRLVSGGTGKKFTLPEVNERINELLKHSIKSEGVINLFSDVQTEFSLFDPKFLEEVANMKEKNLAVELLKKLISEQVSVYRRTNIVKSEKFSEIIQSAMNRYLNGMLTNEEVIQELLKLAKDIAAAAAEGEKLGLTADELAFYDALTKPQAIKDFYQHDELIAITKELTDMLRKNRTIDWQKKESARAGMRRLVKRLLKKHKYPPEGMDDAVQTVMSQCEMWVDNP